MEELKFKLVEKRTFEIYNEIQTFYSKVDKPNVKQVLEELFAKIGDLNSKIKLEIAFVGQYSSGKSTIISALSGNKNIKIGQNITTDKAQGYDWGQVLLVDTPGIYAGRLDHDKISIDYMNKADLLVYVITGQGFSGELAANFQRIAFLENRIDKMMLVINKSSMGSEESKSYWITDALKVTSPKVAEDLFLSIIDANDYIDSFEESDLEDKTELIALSGFNDFVKNLNQFIDQKHLLGRFLTPLNLIEEYLNKVVVEVGVEDQMVKYSLELSSSLLFKLRKSRQRMKTNLDDLKIKLDTKIRKVGDDLASLIEVDMDLNEFQSQLEDSDSIIQNYCEEIAIEVESLLFNEIKNLEIELDSMLERDLTEFVFSYENSLKNFKVESEFQDFNAKKYNKGIEAMTGLLKMLGTFTKNKKAVENGLKGSKMFSGSEVHKGIYAIGKAFKYKFKPYEAIRYTKNVDKISKYGGIAMAFLPLVVTAFEDYANTKRDNAIKDSKLELRQSFRLVAKSVHENIDKEFKNVLAEIYDNKTDDLEKNIHKIKNQQIVKNREVDVLESLLSRVSQTIKSF